MLLVSACCVLHSLWCMVLTGSHKGSDELCLTEQLFRAGFHLVIVVW